MNLESIYEDSAKKVSTWWLQFEEVVGMKNFIKMEKVFKCLKRKKLCEENFFYNLEEDFYYLNDFYKFGYFLMIQTEKRRELFIASKVQNILHILILNLDNYT